MKVTGPPEHLLNEMKQQLELATTKCGSLQQELEMIKDKVRKTSSQTLIKIEENEDDVEESDKNSISGELLGSDLDNEVRKFFLEMPDKSRRPDSASSDSSDVKSTKSKQDIINILFKRLETMENKEESEPSVESKMTYDVDNSSFNEDEFEDVGEYFSSIVQNYEQNEEIQNEQSEEIKNEQNEVQKYNQNEELQTKQNEETIKPQANIENLKIKYQDKVDEKIIKKSLSKIKLTKIKSSKNLRNANKKRMNKHVVPVNDVINFMKKSTKKEKTIKSTIRSGNRKETDFIKKNLIINANPKIKKSKSTVSAPLIGQKNLAVPPTEKKIEKIEKIPQPEKKIEKIPPPPPPPPPPSEKKIKVEPEKKPKIGLEKPKIVIEKPKIGIEKPKIGIEKPKIELEKPKIGLEKPNIGPEKPKEPPKIEKKPELVTSLVEKLNNVKKHQEQRSLVTIPEKTKVQPEKKPKFEPKTKVEAEPKNLSRKNEIKPKIENKSSSKVNIKVAESKVKVAESKAKPANEVVKKVTLFESRNPKPEMKVLPKIDRKVSNMRDINSFPQKIEEKKEKNFDVQSVHSKVATLVPKMSKMTFNGENTIKSLSMPSFKKEKNFGKFSKIPFIVGQSTTKSYHIGLNIQQTLSLFKLTPSLTSLCDNGETKLERSPAYTILVTPDRKTKKPCAACVNPHESDEEESGDPWSIDEKLQSDQRSRQFSQCSCLPGKLVSFHQVLSELFQNENTKMFNYQTEEDSAESQKSCATYRENNAFHHLKLLRKIQKLQETFEK